MFTYLVKLNEHTYIKLSTNIEIIGKLIQADGNFGIPII